MELRLRFERAGRWGLVVLLTAPLLAAVGCGKTKLDTVPVTGKVTYEGNPLPWGTVKFQPADRTASRPGVANIQADGTYSVGTLADTAGLMPGQYKVTVIASKTTLFTPTPEQAAAAAKIPLPTPARYASPANSGLTLTIEPGESAKTLDIDLTK